MPNLLKNPIIRQQANKMADIWAEGDKSDPFTRDRIMSHYDNGIGAYDGEIIGEVRTYIGADGTEKEYVARVPRSFKRP